MPVDPNDPGSFDKPLWCVYGVDCFPEIFCCKILAHAEFGPIIWGYSVYRGVPGFRTLGQNVNTWTAGLEEKYGWDMFEFYDDHGEAISRIVSLTTPAAGAV